jgi:hypothetical protein
MFRQATLTIAVTALLTTMGRAQIGVPTDLPAKDTTRNFSDSRYGVRFRVPPGWNLTRKDREISTFRLDARSALPQSEMRAVATLDFNPFPMSTLSGALFYYSVEPHTTDRECERQATGTTTGKEGAKSDLQTRDDSAREKDLQNIGGMDFVHGHDEHGSICVEARDEVYTAFRKGACYRFDLAVNTFCPESSGAQEITRQQMQDIEERMTSILSTVVLKWEKSGAHPVPVPETVLPEQPTAVPAVVPAKVSEGTL